MIDFAKFTRAKLHNIITFNIVPIKVGRPNRKE